MALKQDYTGGRAPSGATVTSYPGHHIAITKSDVTVYNPPLLSVYCGAAGTVTIADLDGTLVQYTVVAGSTIPVMATKVMSTGTSLTTGMVGLY